MAQPSRQPSPQAWLRRLDAAAASMNPYLTVLTAGLFVLVLACAALLAAQLPIVRLGPGQQVCPIEPAPDILPPPATRLPY